MDSLDSVNQAAEKAIADVGKEVAKVKVEEAPATAATTTDPAPTEDQKAHSDAQQQAEDMKAKFSSDLDNFNS